MVSESLASESLAHKFSLPHSAFAQLTIVGVVSLLEQELDVSLGAVVSTLKGQWSLQSPGREKRCNCTRGDCGSLDSRSAGVVGFVSGMLCPSGVAGRSLVHCKCGGPVREVVTVSRSPGSLKLSNCSFTRVFATAASMSDSAARDSKAVNVVIKGLVQDVFYRKWTVEAAQRLGLKGWVRNLEDGSVEAVISGPSSAVDNMIQQCHSGPSAAKVSSMDVSEWDNEVPQGFEKR